MNWTYYLAQKMKIAVAMAFVIMLVLATNFLSKRHFAKLQDSFTSLYRDRLMVEIYIFDFHRLLNQKNQLLEENASFSGSKYHVINDSIQSLIVDYEKTVLTKEEAVYFGEFKEGLSQLAEDEKKLLIQGGIFSRENTLNDLKERVEYLSLKLDQLSNVQKTEGKRLIDESRKIIASGSITLQLELVILIIIGVVVQVLIFSARSTLPKIDQKSNLN